MKLSVVIPAYNEEKKIEELLIKLKKTKYNVIIVDDGSLDGTNKKIQKSKNPKVQVIRHDVNLGKGEALKTGCGYAFDNGADAVIIMDSDGQHEVQDIEKLKYELENKSCDLVFGARIFKGDIPLVRFLYNKFTSIVINVLYQKYISDVLCGFRGFTKTGYNKIKWKTSGYSVDAEMVVRAITKKVKFCEVGVTTVYYDKYKGVSIKESFEILLHILYWKIFGLK